MEEACPRACFDLNHRIIFCAGFFLPPPWLRRPRANARCATPREPGSGGGSGSGAGRRGRADAGRLARHRSGAFVPVSHAETSTAVQRGSRNRLSHGAVIQRYWRVALMVNTDAPALVGLLPVA